jgi:hypothetical protein
MKERETRKGKGGREKEEGREVTDTSIVLSKLVTLNSNKQSRSSLVFLYVEVEKQSFVSILDNRHSSSSSSSSSSFSSPSYFTCFLLLLHISSKTKTKMKKKKMRKCY